MPIESNLLFRCRRGFRFVNRETRFTGVCLRNRQWERAPRCVPIPTTTRRPVTRTTRTTRRPVTRTTTTTRIVRRGCRRSDIPSDAVLRRRNLRRIRVVCSDRVRGLVAGECLPIDSSVQYRCRRGFRFVGQRTSRFNSLCLRNRQWERIPRCEPIPTPRRN